MVGRQTALLLVATLIAAPFAAPGVAGAQCRLCSAPTTEPQRDSTAPLKLEVRTTLDFDRLILLGTGSGTAVLNPDGSSRAFGAISAVGGRAVAGEVIIRGEPGRVVRVDLPAAIELYGLRGGLIRIEALVSDLPDNPMLDSNGELKVRIGGELKLSGDLDGDFRGDVPIIVDYL